MKYLSWIITCIFGSASIACAQDSKKLERAFQLINNLQVSGAQAEVVAAAKREIAQVAQSLARKEEAAARAAEEAEQTKVDNNK